MQKAQLKNKSERKKKVSSLIKRTRKMQGTKERDRDLESRQQYRKWISKAPAPNGRRSGIDPSLYTWKGYRTWTEQVKRNWSDN